MYFNVYEDKRLGPVPFCTGTSWPTRQRADSVASSDANRRRVGVLRVTLK